MFLLKGCPRCGGDLSVDLEDEAICIQCGHEMSGFGREALSRALTAAATGVSSAPVALATKRPTERRAGINSIRSAS
ncbi:MAG TPA: hypothetical protein VK821_21555 [Dehalococcoidia bacterium]|nr:hypothetical protein [Dehalococcoidia bacterium]